MRKEEKEKVNWREIAIASESDERVLKVLQEGPKSLSQAWMLQAMRYKYGRSGKWPQGSSDPFFMPYNNFS